MAKRFIVLGVKFQVQLGFHKIQCDSDKKSRRNINKYWKKIPSTSKTYAHDTKLKKLEKNTRYYWPDFKSYFDTNVRNVNSKVVSNKSNQLKIISKLDSLTPYYTRLLNYLAKKALQVLKKRD